MQKVRTLLLVIARLAVLGLASWCAAADYPAGSLWDASGFNSALAEDAARSPGLSSETNSARLDPSLSQYGSVTDDTNSGI